MAVAPGDLTAEFHRHTTELAGLRVEAARTAWFHAVVHYERLKARCRPSADDADQGGNGASS